MISYLQGLVATALLFVALTALTGCGGAPLTPAPGDSGSLTTSVADVSPTLRKDLKLEFKLFCSADKTALAASPVATVVDDETLKDTIAFPGVKAAAGDWCALEILAKDASTLSDAAYTWNSKPVQKGLFYATEPAQLDKQRHLTLTLHKLYADGTAPATGDVSVAVTSGADCIWDAGKGVCVVEAAPAPTVAADLRGRWTSACIAGAAGGGRRTAYTFGTDGTFAGQSLKYADDLCNGLAQPGAVQKGRYEPATTARGDGSLVLALHLGTAAKGPMAFLIVERQGDALYFGTWLDVAPVTADGVDRDSAFFRDTPASAT